MKINVGSGVLKLDGFINVDHLALPNVDVVHDLNSSPWPFADESVEHIRAYNILEHLGNTIQVMEEIWRILKPGGTVEICVPYYNSPCAFQDPTHIKFFTEETMDYFAVNGRHSHLNYYSKCRFEITQVVLSPIRSFLSFLPKRALRFLAHNFAIVYAVTFFLQKPPVKSEHEI
ncbi:MAG TPA: methyltransferase domain-containing protein [Kamptonema sp.]|nr:methyltransferase domain-containing protein [Kamptonema sp.]